MIPAAKKAEVVANLVGGCGVKEAAERAGIHRQRVPEWIAKQDSEFLELLDRAGYGLAEVVVDEAVAAALAAARNLTPKAVERIQRGLAITHVNKALSVPQGDGMSSVEIVAVPDEGVAAEIALKFLRFIQEFNPKTQVEHSGHVTLAERLEERAARLARRTA